MMKQFIAALALVALVAGPASTSAQVTTGLKKDLTTTGSDTPYMLVKWEMNGPLYSTPGVLSSDAGTDYSSAWGAQIKPVGQFEADKTITICGIAADSTGALSSLTGVYGDLYYPTNIGLGPDHEFSRPGQTNPQGCGRKINQCVMQQVPSALAHELFCHRIQNNNVTLPMRSEQDVIDYNAFCADQGTYELTQDKAGVYCCDQTLSYEDPAGSYNTVVIAQDDNVSASLSNNMTYVETPMYETDFSSINYGNNVRLNTAKDVNGDYTFQSSCTGATQTLCTGVTGCAWIADPAPAVTGTCVAIPTVRNIGNTRLRMVAWQDDMGFGKTSGVWDVNYAARVVGLGNAVAFTDYLPYSVKPLPTSMMLNTGTQLIDELNLSQTDKMDFRVLVKKWLKDASGNDITNYTGNMRLTAYVANPWTCSATGEPDGTMSTTAPVVTDWPTTAGSTPVNN